MKYVTESESNHKDLDKMTTEQLLRGINQEDKTVPLAVEKAIPAITEFVEKALPRMKEGGRLFYIGAGTWAVWVLSTLRRYLPRTACLPGW